MFVFQFDVAAKAGFWVTVITMGLSAFVAILIFIAQNLFRSGDFNVQCRRHAYIDRRDVRLDMTFENVDAKDRVYSGFDLYGKKDGDRVINNADDLAMYLLEVGHVACVGGTSFGAPECIRMSYATSDENIVEAMRRIKETLAKLK